MPPSSNLNHGRLGLTFLIPSFRGASSLKNTPADGGQKKAAQLFTGSILTPDSSVVSQPRCNILFRQVVLETAALMDERKDQE